MDSQPTSADSRSSIPIKGEVTMTGLSDNAQAEWTMIAGVLKLVAVATIPASIVNIVPAWVPAGLFFCGVVGDAIMQKLGSSGASTSSNPVNDFVKSGPVILKYRALPPAQQDAIAAILSMEEPAPVVPVKAA